MQPTGFRRAMIPTSPRWPTIRALRNCSTRNPANLRVRLLFQRLPSRTAIPRSDRLDLGPVSPLVNNSTLDQIARRPLRVVALGGGTGLSTLLRGLKKYVVDPGVSRIAQ